MKVVIGYDGSDCAKAAIEDLRRAGPPRNTTVLVVSAADTLLPVPSPSSPAIIERAQSRRVTVTLVQAHAEAAQAIEEATAPAHEGRTCVQDRFPEWHVEIHPVVGPPVDAVVQAADDSEADLVVVGSHGRSALARLVLGSVSKHIAMESRHSVRVARRVVDRRNRPVRIIVGVDGSANAQASVRVIAARSWPPGTAIRVVVADDAVVPIGTIGLVLNAAARFGGSADASLALARAMLEDAARQLLHAGLLVSARIRKGDAAHVLKDEARAWDANCIVVGARGFNTAREPFRADSVSSALVSTAPCSVEIIRATASTGLISADRTSRRRLIEDQWRLTEDA